MNHEIERVLYHSLLHLCIQGNEIQILFLQLLMTRSELSRFYQLFLRHCFALKDSISAQSEDFLQTYQFF